MTQDGLDEAFAQLAATVDYTLYVVTARAGGERAGCVIGFASQVSIHPARFLACLSKKNHTYPVARASETLVVHPLPAEGTELAELFGGETGDEVDKFARCRWADGPAGVPVLCDLPAWFAGQVLEQVDFGDHVGFLLEPTAIHPGDAAPTLTFRRGRWIEPGHEP